MKAITTLGIILMLVVSGLLLAFGWNHYYGACGITKVEQASEAYEDLLGRWDDAILIASSTGRISLAGPVQHLQELQDEAGDIEVPPCLTDYADHVSNGMDYQILGFLSFMQDEDDSTVEGFFGLAETKFFQADERMTTVKECAPYCSR